jgi:hypothetical protein
MFARRCARAGSPCAVRFHCGGRRYHQKSRRCSLQVDRLRYGGNLSRAVRLRICAWPTGKRPARRSDRGWQCPSCRKRQARSLWPNARGSDDQRPRRWSRKGWPGVISDGAGRAGVTMPPSLPSASNPLRKIKACRHAGLALMNAPRTQRRKQTHHLSRSHDAAARTRCATNICLLPEGKLTRLRGIAHRGSRSSFVRLDRQHCRDARNRYAILAAATGRGRLVRLKGCGSRAPTSCSEIEVSTSNSKGVSHECAYDKPASPKHDR